MLTKIWVLSPPSKSSVWWLIHRDQIYCCFESDHCSNNASTQKISVAVQSADLEDTMVMNIEEELNLEEEDEIEESKLEKEIEAEADTDPDVQALEEDEGGSVCDDEGNIGRDLLIPPLSKGHTQPLPMSDPSSKILTNEGAFTVQHGATAFLESEQDEDFSQELAAASSCSSDEPEHTTKPPAAAKSPPIRRPATVIGPSSVPTQTIPSIPKGPLPFILSDKELQKVPPPGSSDPDGVLKYSFAVDLQRVPGRTHRWTGFAGWSNTWLAPGAPRAHFSIRELACAQDCTATPAANHLIKDPDLTNIGCAYMPDYDIIICRNVQEGKICGYGVPLANLVTHGECVHHIPFCKKTGTSSGQKYYKPHQKEFLHRILAQYPKIVATSPELHDAHMCTDQFGPIPHIGAKSFDRDRTAALWLPVPPGQYSTGMPSRTGLPKTFGSLLASGLSRRSQQTGQITDPTPVIPFFQQNGALDLIQQFNPDDIACLIALPTLQEPALCMLKAVVVDRFKLLCESIPKVNTLSQGTLGHPQECVQEKAYTTCGPSLPLEEKPQLVLTGKQLSGTQALLQALASHQQISHLQLMPLINDVLQDIYMPDNSFDMIKNSFVNPANIFTCFQSVASQGGFEEPRNCSDEQLYDQFSLEMQRIITHWGSEEHTSPLAFVWGWMRAMSHVAHRAPSKNLIMWDMEGTRLTIQNHPVVLSEYFSAIQTSLEALVHKVDGDVLFHIQFPPGSFDPPSEETNDTKTPGFDLFSPPEDALSLDAHPTAFFLERLCNIGRICTRWDDQIVWQYDHLGEWLTAIAAACNYNKTSATTGLHKYILWVIPFALATVITKLVQIMRPLEALALASQTVYRKEEGSTLAKATNRAMGHGEEVADLNYAQEAGDLSMDISDQWMMEHIGADWIRLDHVDVGKAGTSVESPPSS
ncbi:hypothetical protein F5141DRAFT_1060467 [Pisolithus sp. B1]|nr:hypothetical protein F5141DRAFT_1060467 [Pisolithus sp. B1]